MFSEFEYPYLLGLGIIPIAWLVLFYQRKFYRVRSAFTMVAPIFQNPSSLTAWLYKLRPHTLLLLETAVMSVLVVAIAGPFRLSTELPLNQHGIEIVLALDVSGSMREEDLRPNRLEAAKTSLAEFTRRRIYDRLGLVIFGSDAWVQSPQTTEHEGMADIIEQVQLHDELARQTAIGEALMVGASRMHRSPTKNRLIVLVSDGENTANDKIDPKKALETVGKVGIKVYTIGIGEEGQGTDFELLRQIASRTGGRFYNARSATALKRMVDEIDRLEKSPFLVGRQTRRISRSGDYMVWALFLLGFYFLGRYVALPDRTEN